MLITILFCKIIYRGDPESGVKKEQNAMKKKWYLLNASLNTIVVVSPNQI